MKRSGVEERLQAYCSLLLSWNSKINLIGKATAEEIFERHVLDCLQLANYIDNNDKAVVDIGSGAGLPGLILSIAGIKNLCLIEADEKKCVFLRMVRRELGLDCEIINERIENITDQRFDIVVSRALAPLELLLQYASHLLKPTGNCLFLKGGQYKNEIDAAQRKYQFDFVSHPSKTSCDGIVLEVKNIKGI